MRRIILWQATPFLKRPDSFGIAFSDVWAVADHQTTAFVKREDDLKRNSATNKCELAGAHENYRIQGGIGQE